MLGWVPLQCLTQFEYSVPVHCFNEFQHSALIALKCAVQGQGGREGEDDEAGDTFPFHRQQGREGSRGAAGERRQGERAEDTECRVLLEKRKMEESRHEGREAA